MHTITNIPPGVTASPTTLGDKFEKVATDALMPMPLVLAPGLLQAQCESGNQAEQHLIFLHTQCTTAMSTPLPASPQEIDMRTMIDSSATMKAQLAKITQLTLEVEATDDSKAKAALSALQKEFRKNYKGYANMKSKDDAHRTAAHKESVAAIEKAQGELANYAVTLYRMHPVLRAYAEDTPQGLFFAWALTAVPPGM
jgi:hypothetical protein